MYALSHSSIVPCPCNACNNESHAQQSTKQLECCQQGTTAATISARTCGTLKVFDLSSMPLPILITTASAHLFFTLLRHCEGNLPQSYYKGSGEPIAASRGFSSLPNTISQVTFQSHFIRPKRIPVTFYMTSNEVLVIFYNHIEDFWNEKLLANSETPFAHHLIKQAG